jgi:hypothetical protein
LRASEKGLVQPLGSLVLCIGLGAIADDLATELLVRILRELHLDARHLTVEDFHAPRPPDVKIGTISAFCIVSVTPGPERERGAEVAREIRAKLPHVHLLALLLPSVLEEPDGSNLGEVVDRQMSSFGDAAIEISEHVAAPVAVPVVETDAALT